MKKKTNPRKIPVCKADIAKAYQDGIHTAFVVFLNVLRDKFGFTNDQIADVFEELNDLCDSINQGYASIGDLKDVLQDEAGITRDSDKEGRQR